jgi:diaminopimelate epimerase
MKLKFTKMHGLGNDFIVIDCRRVKVPGLATIVKKTSHRRLGIGFDQALILLSSKKADFRMDIYNTDGGRVEMCGNGIRCLARYIWDRRISRKDVLEIETLAGIMRPKKSGRMVRVDMGEPIFEGSRIPVKKKGMVIGHTLRVRGDSFRITCVSMGNPHCVIFVDNVDNFPVDSVGPAIEVKPFFPKRVNVEFVEVLNEKELKIRVWERGAGETLACGTGACASAVAASLTGLAGDRITVHLIGGDLKVEWSRRDNHVYMTGPAAEVFEGVAEV